MRDEDWNLYLELKRRARYRNTLAGVMLVAWFGISYISSSLFPATPFSTLVYILYTALTCVGFGFFLVKGGLLLRRARKLILAGEIE